MAREELPDEPDSASADGAAMPDEEGLVRVTGTVKWFDATRGFGFIVSEEAEGDILIHFSVLKDMAALLRKPPSPHSKAWLSTRIKDVATPLSCASSSPLKALESLSTSGGLGRTSCRIGI